MTLSRFAVLLLVFLASCASGKEPGPISVYVVPVGTSIAAESIPPNAVVAHADLAFTPRDRSNGLMGRKSLEPDTGMLFIYPEQRELRFWMKNTLIPLSAAFANESGRIVRIHEMTPDPMDGRTLPYYMSGEEAIFVLEMARGWFGEQGIEEGERMTFHPSILAINPD